MRSATQRLNNVTRPINKVSVIKIMRDNLENTITKEISNQTRNFVFQFLSLHLKNDKLSHDATNVAVYNFCLS